MNVAAGAVPRLASVTAVVTERVDRFTIPGGKRVTNHLVAVFEVDDEGSIVSWREYWDTVALAASMGTSPRAPAGAGPVH